MAQWLTYPSANLEVMGSMPVGAHPVSAIANHIRCLTNKGKRFLKWAEGICFSKLYHPSVDLFCKVGPFYAAESPSKSTFCRNGISAH